MSRKFMKRFYKEERGINHLNRNNNNNHHHHHLNSININLPPSFSKLDSEAFTSPTSNNGAVMNLS
jgi:hypothetical protein